MNFEEIIDSARTEREAEHERQLSAARREAREARHAAKMWRTLAWAAVVVALVVLFLAIQSRADAAEVVPVKEAVVQYAPPPEPMPEVDVSEMETTTRRLHGSCRITAYCACEICCGEWAKDRPLDENGNPIVYGASGNVLTPGVSVACSLPFGTKIEIDGLPGTYAVEDRTAEWIQDKYSGMTVDIYMPTHESCYELLAGMPEWMDVYIVEG